mmetsp:Transcript_1649/g.2937  ORF Transcript_1649/g.2937 Transcript_1649/m.2937 type:complete len:172 (-) Transcript_1649:986-1501(-)
MGGRVLVTVGSTEFSDLVQVIDQDPVLQLLFELGYSCLSIQYGRGQYEPQVGTRLRGKMTVDGFRYKSDLRMEMDTADLIISHAGAGSIMEALTLKKKLIIVVNDKLMDNHQAELANQMHKLGYAISTTCNSLYEVLGNADFNSLKHLPNPKSGIVTSIVDEELEYSHKLT